MTDVFYYNIGIGNNDASQAGNLNFNNSTNQQSIKANVNALNTNAICDNPSDYYCSIIRFSIAGFNFPVAYPIIQTPVLDINKTIYSFTLSKGGFDSSQTFINFVPQLILSPELIPQVGTPTQTFNQYYQIFTYNGIIDMWNTALQTATNELNILGGFSLSAPFFVYDSDTQLISLYTVSGEFDNDILGAAQIFFNNSFFIYFVGLPIVDGIYYGNTIDGKDTQIRIRDNKTNRIQFLNDVKTYLKNSYDYSAYSYWNSLKSILITTEMNVRSEIFFINNPSNIQNQLFVNVLTDYIPDLSQPQGAGLAQQIYSYNATSLYRIFEFKQKSPLYQISLKISYLDQYNNVFDINTDKGTSNSFKLMFIKKSLYNSMNFKALQIK